MPRPDLTLVVPAYNEESSIQSLISEWTEHLGKLEMSYELRIYDDGSRDDTASVVERLASENPQVVLIRQKNRGHGPTVLRGYLEAEGEWVAQVDADDEVPASEFHKLWSNRESFDFLLGYRVGRQNPIGRKALSALSRGCILLLFGKKLKDVNAPFRLMRKSRLTPLVKSLPSETLTPNVILSGLAGRAGLRVAEFPVEFRGRTAGQTTLGGLRVWRLAWRALLQTLRTAWTWRGRE